VKKNSVKDAQVLAPKKLGGDAEKFCFCPGARGGEFHIARLPDWAVSYRTKK
jgi:hypothetical protein